MVACALSVSGVWFAQSARDGQFFNQSVYVNLVRPMLRGLHADRNGIIRMPDSQRCIEIAELTAKTWVRRVRELTLAQGYESGPWGYLGSDATLLWPVWAAAYPNARWIIARRDDDSIIESCGRTKYMGPRRTREQMARWIADFEKRFSALRARVDVKEIWPAEFIAGDLTSLQGLFVSLGLGWDEQKIRDALAPVLWGNGVFSDKKVVSYGAGD
jgi:hypothetical protein